MTELSLAEKVEGLDPDYALAVAAGWTKVERDPSPDRCEDGPVWHHAELDRAMPLDTSCRDLCREVGADDEEEVAALLRAKGGDSPHSDALAVDRFAAAMKTKLAQKRAEGRGGWDDKDACSGEWLSRLLRGHVEKGDPVDVANFAMMLHQRGERIAP